MSDTVHNLVIPAENEPYAPRDIQLVLRIEDEYLSASPVEPDSIDRLNGFVFNVDWKTMKPAVVGPYDEPDVATVALRIVPKSALASGLDPSRADFSSYKSMADRPVVDTVYGLSRRVNNRQSRTDGPVDELLTKQKNSFDFLIDCYDSGNPERHSCSMQYIVDPPGALGAKSNFALQTSVTFQRRVLKDWQTIKSNVDAFLSRRAEFVPFGQANVGGSGS